MRESGILMHITSLPGPCGIGTMGEAAYGFVDFLDRAGQSYWQILPLTPTGFGDSPYQSFSAWAGNPYLIDLDILARQGLLRQEEYRPLTWYRDPGRVDFGIQYRQRRQILELACNRFRPEEDYETFLRQNRDWLEDYGLFMALKEAFHGAPWQDWPGEFRDHSSPQVAQKRRDLTKEIAFQYFLQYQFHHQWKALRAYANSKGIRIIGDVPIYVPLDSADVWARPRLYQLDENHRPKVVAGCPPDAFTADGQKWGNPIYDWKAMADTDYAWWLRRLKAASEMYDVVRLDHFRGFESYWAIPAGDKTARYGKWEKGPGTDFIRTVKKELPEMAFIAEDLGFLTQEVRHLQRSSGYPGMKVLQFAFDSREESDYLPHLYPVDSVCYTGTHDNVPLRQWLEEASREDVDYARAYLGLNREEGYIQGMIRGAMSSVSRLCVVQMQDYLELGKEARMNFPGTLSPDNWTWRAEEGFDTPQLAKRIRAITRLYGREKADPGEAEE